MYLLYPFPFFFCILFQVQSSMDESADGDVVTNRHVLDRLDSSSSIGVATWLHKLLPEDQQKRILINSIQKPLTKLKLKNNNLKKLIARAAGKAAHKSFLAEKFQYPGVNEQARGKKKQTREPVPENPPSPAPAASSSVDQVNNKLASSEAKLKRVRSAVDYRDGKIRKLQNELDNRQGNANNHVSCCQEIDELKETILNLQEKNKTLKVENQTLKSHVIKTIHVDPQTKKQCYTPETVQCVYALLEHHVGETHVSECMSSVLKLMSGKTCSDLPSRKSIQNWNISRLSLCQKQLAEEFSSKPHTTLYSDETSKYGDKFMGYHASDENKRYWVLGLRDIASKSSENTLATFKELLSDITNGCSRCNNRSRQKNFMSHP